MFAQFPTRPIGFHNGVGGSTLTEGFMKTFHLSFLFSGSMRAGKRGELTHYYYCLCYRIGDEDALYEICLTGKGRMARGREHERKGSQLGNCFKRLFFLLCINWAESPNDTL